jgi:UDP-GlcNAc:undecaprenyl-phosphate/decaprenyl-phosphate GlcNAc-1-phosphate transferase
MFFKILIVILFTIFISQKFIILSIKLLKNADCTLKNYRGFEVIFGMGIVFVPIIITSVALMLILNYRLSLIYMPYLFAICAIAFAGLLDDLIGNKQVKGLKRHIVRFIKGELTTGFIKAFIGTAASIIISIEISVTLFDFMLNVLNIALFTNALNLMDLRPGRCIKVFSTLGFIILLTNLNEILVLLPLIVVLTASIIYARYDLKEICILGDTGSNILGITLGYFSSITYETIDKIIIFFALFTINALAEKFSITKIISNNRVLNYLDNLGRSSG